MRIRSSAVGGEHRAASWEPLPTDCWEMRVAWEAVRLRGQGAPGEAVGVAPPTGSGDQRSMPGTGTAWVERGTFPGAGNSCAVAQDRHHASARGLALLRVDLRTDLDRGPLASERSLAAGLPLAKSARHENTTHGSRGFLGERRHIGPGVRAHGGPHRSNRRTGAGADTLDGCDQPPLSRCSACRSI